MWLTLCGDIVTAEGMGNYLIRVSVIGLVLFLSGAPLAFADGEEGEKAGPPNQETPLSTAAAAVADRMELVAISVGDNTAPLDCVANPHKCYVATACAIAIENYGSTFQISNRQAAREARATFRSRYRRDNLASSAKFLESQELGYPDWVLLDKEKVEDARSFRKALWKIQYGERYELASPAKPTTPSGDLKIGNTVARANGLKLFYIPAILRTLSNEVVAGRVEATREVNSFLTPFAAETLRVTGRPYLSEPVVRVNQAINEVQSNSAMAGVSGLLLPMITIVQEAMDDYVSTLDYSIELDLVQNQMFTLLGKEVLYGRVDLSRNLRLSRVIQALDATTLSDEVRVLPESIQNDINFLVSENSTLSDRLKSRLAEINETMQVWSDRLTSARERYGKSFSASLMAYYLISEIAKPDGFSETEAANFLANMASPSLNGRRRLWVYLGTLLLCRQQIVNPRVDELIDLTTITDTEIIAKYLDDPRIHEMAIGMLTKREYLEAEFRLGPELAAARQQLDALKAQLGSRKSEALEKRLKTGATEAVNDLASNSVVKRTIPTSALKMLLGTLEESDGVSGSLALKPGTPPIKARVRSLPNSFPAYLKQAVEGYKKSKTDKKIWKIENALETAWDDYAHARRASENAVQVDESLVTRMNEAHAAFDRAQTAYVALLREHASGVASSTDSAPSTNPPPVVGVDPAHPVVITDPAHPNPDPAHPTPTPTPLTPETISGPQIFRSLQDVLLALDSEAERHFNLEIIRLRTQSKPNEPWPLQTPEQRIQFKQARREQLQLLRQVMIVQTALEQAIAMEDKAAMQPKAGEVTEADYGRASADATATMAHFLVRLAPTLSRAVIHDTSLPVLSGLRRRVVIEIIKGMLERPDEIGDEFEIATSTWGRPFAYISANWKTSKFRTLGYGLVMVGAVGMSAWLGYEGWQWWKTPAVTTDKPAVVQPLDPKPKTTDAGPPLSVPAPK